MIEYIVFFGLLAAGLLAYIFFPKTVKNRSGKSPNNSVFLEINKCESYIERRLYQALFSRGYSVKTQEWCGKYRIDLALVGPRIAIEM